MSIEVLTEIILQGIKVFSGELTGYRVDKQFDSYLITFNTKDNWCQFDLQESEIKNLTYHKIVKEMMQLHD